MSHFTPIFNASLLEFTKKIRAEESLSIVFYADKCSQKTSVEVLGGRHHSMGPGHGGKGMLGRGVLLPLDQ